MVIRAWLPSMVRPSIIFTKTTGVGAGNRFRMRVLEQPDATFSERPFQDQRCVGVLVRQQRGTG